MIAGALNSYRSAIAALNPSLASPWPQSLLMRRDGDWATYYAPFDHVNGAARLVLVGITPGWRQAVNAWTALQAAWTQGLDDLAALREAKGVASFSGPMRQNLIDLLDHVGLASVLGIGSCAELFGARRELVHYTSALRYPVTYRDANYGGSPRILSNVFTRTELSRWFVQEMAALNDPIIVPLGPAVSEALRALARQSKLQVKTILYDLPHPSPRQQRTNPVLSRPQEPRTPFTQNGPSAPR